MAPTVLSKRALLRSLVLLVFGAALVYGSLEVWEELSPRVRAHVARLRVEDHVPTLLQVSDESGVDPYLLAGVMQAESSGRVGVVSSAGALGLFQLMPATAKERAQKLGLPEPSEEDLLSDALLNARLGADYLAWLLRRYEGNEERALVAYNTGPTRLLRWEREAGGWEPWRAERLAAGNSDVLAYARKVLDHKAGFQRRGLFDGVQP